MGDCRGLKSIYRSDAAKGSTAVKETVTKTIAVTTKGLMRRIGLKKNVTRTLVMPTRILIEASAASLVGKSPWITDDKGSLL
jgi:hypothetical protein